VNVWISSLAGRWAGTIFSAMKQGQLRLIVSSGLLDELQDVISRPRMRRWFDARDGEDMVSALANLATLVEPRTVVTACRDPDGNYLLALAESANADFLVSRDEDLLVLARWKRTTICSPHDFLRQLRELQIDST